MMLRHTRRDSIHCLIEELMLIPDVLLHKEEEEEKKRKKKKKNQSWECVVLFGFGHRQWGVSLSG